MASKIKNWGFKVLGVWLLMYGLNHLFDLHFDGFYVVMGILALISGILIIAER